MILSKTISNCNPKGEVCSSSNLSVPAGKYTKIGFIDLSHVEADRNKDSFKVKFPWLVGYEVERNTIGIFNL